MSENLHHPFGPSSLERRANCPGSFHMEDGLPEKKSEWAKMGTRLHEATWSEAIRKTITDTSDIEALENVAEALEQFKIEKWFAEERLECLDYEENEFDPPVLYFGTVDAIGIIDEESALIADFKYGWQPVAAPENNLQLAAYAVALHQKFPHLKKIFGAIIQPRISPFANVYEYTKFDAMFANIKHIITEATEADSYVLNVGDHCKYCRANQFCPEVRKQGGELVKQTDVLNLITVDNAADYFSKAKAVKSRMDDILLRIREMLENGEELPGLRLKRTMGNKQIKDINQAYGAVQAYYPDPQEFIKHCKLSIRSLEADVAKKLKDAGHAKTLKEAKQMVNDAIEITRGVDRLQVVRNKK